MQRLATRIAVLNSLLILPLIPLDAQQSRLPGPIDVTHRVILRGSIHPKAHPGSDQGRVDPLQRIGYVTLLLKPSAEQQADLENLLEQQQDPTSSNYHRWLTPEQFADRFSLTRSDLATVVSWIQSHGLRIENIARARNWVAFSGTAAQMQNVFRTEIHHYVVDGETHFANATELSIPAALENLVSGVRGLDDFSPGALLRPSRNIQLHQALLNWRQPIGPPSTTSPRSIKWESMVQVSASLSSDARILILPTWLSSAAPLGCRRAR